MEDRNITYAKYRAHALNGNEAIIATIDGIDMVVPLCVGNADYDEIMRQVDAGTLTIQDAD
jgi:hypothetical protein